MPRLSRSDAERVVRALDALLSASAASTERAELERVAARLSARLSSSRRSPARQHSSPNERATPTAGRTGLEAATRAAAPSTRFAARTSIAQVEEGLELAPRFGTDGLLPCVTSDAATGEVLMLGYMDAAALGLTLATGEAHYWSRSRRSIWRKGATSGLVQKVVELRIDDDQDAIWLRVQVAGNGSSCHVGYRSCFYRAIEPASAALRFVAAAKEFEPRTVYGDTPSPTAL